MEEKWWIRISTKTESVSLYVLLYTRETQNPKWGKEERNLLLLSNWRSHQYFH